jgi:hypothetical protein
MLVNERQLYILLETTKDTLTIRGGNFTFGKEEREGAVMAIIESMKQGSVNINKVKPPPIPSVPQPPSGNPSVAIPNDKTSSDDPLGDHAEETRPDPLAIPEELKPPKPGKLSQPRIDLPPISRRE